MPAGRPRRAWGSRKSGCRSTCRCASSRGPGGREREPARLSRRVVRGAGHHAPARLFRARLRRGRCLVLLDGLDEVADEAERRAMSAWVDRLVAVYPDNRYVVTSRPPGYERAPLGKFTVLERARFQRGRRAPVCRLLVPGGRGRRARGGERRSCGSARARRAATWWRRSRPTPRSAPWPSTRSCSRSWPWCTATGPRCPGGASTSMTSACRCCWGTGTRPRGWPGPWRRARNGPSCSRWRSRCTWKSRNEIGRARAGGARSARCCRMWAGDGGATRASSWTRSRSAAGCWSRWAWSAMAVRT